MTSSDDDRRQATRLFTRAGEFVARQEYQRARECYEQSLRLYEDEEVRAAYLEVLAIIGPI